MPAPPATMVSSVATTSEAVSESVAAPTVTVAVEVSATPPTVAETVLVSATVEASVAVVAPAASVTTAGGVSVFPVPVASTVTVAPAMALPCWSRAVTVIVLGAPPAVMDAGSATMVETAASLGRAELPGRTVVLTGAMVPYAFGNSDALFNLGCALTAVQVLPAGVYITMNGKLFRWDNVRKNKGVGEFEELSPAGA